MRWMQYGMRLHSPLSILWQNFVMINLLKFYHRGYKSFAVIELSRSPRTNMAQFIQFLLGVIPFLLQYHFWIISLHTIHPGSPFLIVFYSIVNSSIPKITFVNPLSSFSPDPEPIGNCQKNLITVFDLKWNHEIFKIRCVPKCEWLKLVSF
jgi:hypothetical protein